MPDPDRLLHTLRRAIQSIRAVPGRRGRLVALQDVDEVLVAGDMHGNLDNFRRLLGKADLARHPRRHFVLQELIHGSFTYPVGGDKSHQLVDLTAALVCQYPRQVHYLLGNHELAQGTQRRIAKGDDDLNTHFRIGVDTAYGPRSADVYALYLELFAALPVALRTPNRIFLSHSMPPGSRLAAFEMAVLERENSAPEDLVPGGAIHSLVWGRDTRPETVSAFLAKVDGDLLITGHIPCDRGFELPNDRQVILDSLDTPAAYCLFPTDRPLSHQELADCVSIL